MFLLSLKNFEISQVQPSVKWSKLKSQKFLKDFFKVTFKVTSPKWEDSCVKQLYAILILNFEVENSNRV